MLGGTGPMGIHLTRILSKSHDVYITSRSHHENKGSVHYFYGNAKDPVFIKEVLSSEKWDCVIDFMTYKTDEFKNRINLLLSSTSQYVFLSSSRVYANSEDRITEESPRLLDTIEDSRYLDTDEYALYKAREEDIISCSNFRNYTIIRPYITYAENRLPLGIWEKETWVRRLLEGKDLVLPKCFLQKETTLTYGLDVAMYISKIIGNKEAIGEIYNIVGNNSLRWEDVLDAYLDEIEILIGRRPKVLKVESFVSNLKWALYYFAINLCSFGLSLKGKIRNTNYQLIYDREFDRRFDNTKLNKLVHDFRFSDNIEKLKSCLKEFSINPKYNYENWEWIAIQDKILGDNTKLNMIGGYRNKLCYILIRYIIPSKYIVKK